MLLQDFLAEDRVIVNLECSDKADAIEQMVLRGFLRGQCGSLDEDDLERIVQGLQRREQLSPTGIKNGLAIPHAKVAGLDTLIGAIATIPQGLPWGSMDDHDSRIFFVLLSPEARPGEHLKALARIARLFSENSALSTKLLTETSAADIFQMLTLEDAHLDARRPAKRIG